MKRLIFFALVVILLSACGSKASQLPTQESTLVTTVLPQATSTPTDIITPLPSATIILQAEDILTSSGFVHHPDLDGVDTCRVVGCEVYESKSDGINAWVYPDSGSLMLMISSNNQYDSIQQEKTISRVITLLFGRNVNSWITSHPATSLEQDGQVDNHTIGIIFTEVLDMTTIVIAPEQKPTQLSTLIPQPSPTFGPTGTPGLGSLQKPYPMGSVGSVWQISGAGVRSDFTIKVLQIIRGKVANDYMAPDISVDAAQPAALGMEWMLVQVEITLVSGGELQLHGDYFKTISDGQVIEQAYIAQYDSPYPALNADLLLPGHVTGWLYTTVNIDDPRPLIAFGMSYGGSADTASFFAVTPIQ